MGEFILLIIFLVIFGEFYLQRQSLRDLRERFKSEEKMFLKLADSITQSGRDVLRSQAEINERLKILEERKKPGRKKKTGTGEQGEIKK